MLSPSIVAARAFLACASLLPQDGSGLALRLDEARDATAEGLAFVETVAAKESWLAEEPIRLTLRLGIEEEFLRTKAVQPFGRALGVPVQVSAPWVAEVRERAAGDLVASDFALNERVERIWPAGDREIGGRTYRVYEVDASVSAASAGELVLPGPVLAFAYATKFEDSLVRGRAPLDRVDAFVRGEPVRLAVRAWPEEGRPAEFAGAVGTFTVRAKAEPREVAMGESLELELTIEGEGNLARFEPPRLERVGAFRVLGVVDEPSPRARRFVYDLAPESEQAWQIPAVAFGFLDPGPPPAYRVVRTEPIEVAVRSAPGGPSGRPSPDPAAEIPVVDRGSGRAWLAWGSGAIVIALALWVLAGRRPAETGS